MDLDRQRRIRAVLDTNVLLGVARRRLLLLASLDAYQLVTSQYILTRSLSPFVRHASVNWPGGAFVVQSTQVDLRY